ncbi:MAG TPA: ATP-binding protein [Pyrinomonadaceae bacterium]|nr:ATP-binding protein [Pyrinomonadaceae bacterium]
MLSVLGMTGVTVEQTELKLPSRLEAVAEGATAVADLLNRAGVSEEAAFGIDMAVREGIANAVIHGNKLDEEKLITIVVTRSVDSLEIIVRDQGSGFDAGAISDPTAAENILKTSGRGIFFMRNFMDEVSWSVLPEGGTSLRMIKKLENS